MKYVLFEAIGIIVALFVDHTILLWCNSDNIKYPVLHIILAATIMGKTIDESSCFKKTSSQIVFVVVQLGWFLTIEILEWGWKTYSPATSSIVFYAIEQFVVNISILIRVFFTKPKPSDKNLD